MKIHFWFNLGDSDDAGIEITHSKVNIKIDHTGYVVKLGSYTKEGKFKKKDKDGDKEEKKEGGNFLSY